MNIANANNLILWFVTAALVAVILLMAVFYNISGIISGEQSIKGFTYIRSLNQEFYSSQISASQN